MRPPTPARAPRRAVLLPGAGSDEVFLARAFAAALAERGIVLTALGWSLTRPTDVVAQAFTALERAARGPGAVLVGGVSLGGVVALAWALAHPDRCAGVLVAMPAWLGEPDRAPAALAARAGATGLRAKGLDAVLRDIARDSPPWLAAELARAWSGQGSRLLPVLDACAAHHAPTQEQIAALAHPIGIAALTDDPLHPLDVARRMVAAAQNARLRTATVAELGVDAAVLGRRAVAAWMHAAAPAGSGSPSQTGAPPPG